MFYVINIKDLSNGTQDRNLTAYSDYNTALRKFHEAFNVVGGGPTRITSMLLCEPTGTPNISGVEVFKNETWIQEVTAEE